MSVTVRGITEADSEDFLEAIRFTFGVPPSQDLEESNRRFLANIEPDRARCAFVGPKMVGTLGTFSLSMTVPGRPDVPVAGTTMVTVSPTHRRRGVLRDLMAAHFEEVRERGESLAALYASDSAIYGRFGYGMASVWADTTIGRDHVARHPRVHAPAEIEVVDHERFMPEAERTLDSIRLNRPGMYVRSTGFWERRVDDRDEERDGASALRRVLAVEDGQVTGYALYRIKLGHWENNHADAVVRVNEVHASTPAAASGLWGFLLDHDLIKEIKVFGIASDDPLFALLAGSRRAAPTFTDQVFVRIMDPVAALEGRSYQADGRLVIDVHDGHGFASGTFEIQISDGAARVQKFAGEADIELDAEDLGSVYLGRSRLAQLGLAGRVRGNARALFEADRLFGWPVQPWCQDLF